MHPIPPGFFVTNWSEARVKGRLGAAFFCGLSEVSSVDATRGQAGAASPLGSGYFLALGAGLGGFLAPSVFF